MNQVKTLLVFLSLGMMFIISTTSVWGMQQAQSITTIKKFQKLPSISIVEKKAVYMALVDRYVAHCDYKVVLQDSRSPKLRQKAEISHLKAAYVNNNRERIIEKLIKTDIAPEMYKVQYVVNAMFYDLIRGEVMVAQR